METAAHRVERPFASRAPLALLDEIARSRLFAYGSVLLLQAKVLWGIWHYRDLSGGDTSAYFVNATAWTDHRLVDPLFSPLYTVFWGSLQWLIPGVYAVTITHRILIALAVTLLVLALFRRLLSPTIAWALGVWWAVLPLNYDTLNEVHLFAVLPLLGAGIVALRHEGPRMRAAVFAILLGAAVLVRNEYVIAALVWLAICAVYEWRVRRRSGGAPQPLRRVANAFGIATLVVVALAGLTLWRAREQDSLTGWIQRAEDKQNFALCQHYAVGYQQRRHANTQRGWLDCESFMRRDFGSPTPSFFEALADNPRAMGEHFGWNATLLPYELQLAAFDRTSGSAYHDPDYVQVRTGWWPATAGSILIVAFVLLGLGLLWGDRRRWWGGWLAARVWGWAVIGCAAALGLWVAITIHPRPAYVFSLDLALFAVIGMAAMAVVSRWPALRRLRPAIPLVALLLVVFVPSHYSAGYSNPLYGPGRPVAAMVSHLMPYRDHLRGHDTILLANYSVEGCNYTMPQDACRGAHFGLLPPAGMTARAWLDRNGVDLIYADASMLRDETTRLTLAALQRHGWRRIGPATPSTADWLLLSAPAPPA